MAGDWIKLEVATPDKPEVFRIAEALKLDREVVLARLVRLFVWYDQQLAVSNAPTVTLAMIDGVTNTPGLAQAMLTERWLRETERGLEVTNLDKHNGKSAKERALTKKRVTHFRARNAPVGGSPLPEKNREDKKREKTKSKHRAVAMPDWLPVSVWNDFMAVRVKLGKSPTVRAMELLITKLDELRAAGNDPKAVLEQSIMNSWAGVFALKAERGAPAPGKPNPHGNFNDRDYRQDATDASKLDWAKDDDGAKKD